MTFELRCLFADIDFLKSNIISTEFSCNAEYHSVKHNDTKVDSLSEQYLGQKNKSDVVGLRMFFLSLVLLPTGISTYFPNLQTLWITNSGMESAKRESLKDLKQLKTIYFDKNKLKTLETDLLWDVNELEFLSLNQNIITEIPRNFLKRSINLKQLWMNNNLLEVLEPNTFENNWKLIEIHMEYNKLKIIESEVLNLLTNLQVVNFEDNICINMSTPKTEIDRMKTEFIDSCNGFNFISKDDNKMKQDLIQLQSELVVLQEKLKIQEMQLLNITLKATNLETENNQLKKTSRQDQAENSKLTSKVQRLTITLKEQTDKLNNEKLERSKETLFGFKCINENM